MDQDNHLYQVISAYLDNRLSRAAKEQFESDMNSDPELKQLVADFPLMEEALQAAIAEKEFENIITEEGLKTLHKISESGMALSASKSNNVLPIYTNKWLKYAAAIILILIIAPYPIYFTLYKQSPEQLFASYYDGYPNLEILNTRGSSSNNLLELRIQAYNHYDNQNYTQFIDLLSQLPSEYPSKLNDQFYLGVAYLEIESWQNAINILEGLKDSNFSYNAEVNWQLGMAYLATGECEKAQSVLDEVRNIGPDNKQKASTIMKRIKCP